MPDDQKFIAARARLHALCDNLPSFVYERDVSDYHGILKDIEASTGYDLSAFKIAEDRVEYPIVSVVRRSYSGRPGSVTRGKEKKCDDTYFGNQVRAAREFLHEMRRQSAPSIPHSRESPVTVSIQGGVHGSTIQTASPHATATTSSSIDVKAIGDIIAKLKAEKTTFGLAEPLRNQLDSNIKTIEQELAAPMPRQSVLRSCLEGLKTVLLNIGGGVAANAIWAEITHYLASHP